MKAIIESFNNLGGIEKISNETGAKLNYNINVIVASNPEGNGPSSGEPRKIGVVIASPSPYHLDVVAASIINLKPIEVPTIKRCVERNICTGNLEDIDIIGEDIDKFIIKDYVIPKPKKLKLVRDWMPKFLISFINNTTRPKPVFNHDACIGCRDCEEACPPKVIAMEKNKPVG